MGRRVISPDGVIGEVPEEDLELATANGYRLLGSELPGTAQEPPAPEQPTGDPGAIADPQAPAVAPVEAPVAERMVRVTAPDGTVGTVPESDLDAAREQGYTLPNEDALSVAATFAEGLPMGLTEPVAWLEGAGAKLGSEIAEAVHGLPGEGPTLAESVQQARGDIEARKEANPWAAMAGAGVGTAATLIATRGAAGIPAVEALTARATGAVAAKLGVDAAKIATSTLGKRIILQTIKAGIPNAIEGAVLDSAIAADDALQAAYKVDGELDAGDLASVAQAGLSGMLSGAAIGFAVTGGITGVTETIRSGGRAVGGMFSRAGRALTGGGDDAAKLPSGDTVVPSTPDADIDAVAMKRLEMDVPSADVQPPPPVPGESVALARVGEAELGSPSPFAKHYDPAAQVPDAEKLIDAQGPLLFGEIGAAERKTAETMNDVFEEGRRAVNASANFDDIVEHYGKQIVDDMTELAQIVDRSATLNGAGAKAAFIAREFNVPGASFQPDERTVSLIQGMARRIASLGEGSVYELGKFGGRGKAKTMARGLFDYAKLYERDMLEGRAGDAFNRLDSLKRMFGDFAKMKNSKLSALVTGPDGDSGLYGELRHHLQDDEVFGGLAQIQRPANATWSTAISASDDRSLRDMFIQAGESATNAFKKGQRANGSFVRNILENTSNWAKSKDQEAWVRYLRATSNDLTQRGKSWGDAVAKTDAARAQVITARIEASRNAVAYAQRGKDAVAASTEGLVGVGGLAKKAVDVAQRAARSSKSAKRAVETAKRVGRAARRRPTPAESVTHAAVDANTHITRSARQAAEGAAEVHVRDIPGTGRGARRAAAESSARVGTAAGVQASRAATAALIQSRFAEADPASPASRERMHAPTYLAGEAPELVQPLQELQAAKDAWFREKASTLAATGKVDPVSEMKIMRYWEATEDPEGAIDRIASGVVRAEDVETLWHLYPTLMTKFRDQTFQAIVSSGARPTRAAMQRFRRAFRLTDTGYMQWIQAATAAAHEIQEPEQPKPVSANVKFELPSTQLKADRLVAR